MINKNKKLTKNIMSIKRKDVDHQKKVIDMHLIMKKIIPTHDQ